MSKSTISRLFTLCLLLISGVCALGQGEYIVSTNRPNQTDAILLVPEGAIQLEAGIGYSGTSSSTEELDILFLPSLQVRYGLKSKIELNIFYDYNSVKYLTSFQDVKYSNHVLTLGSKFPLWNENGAIPQATAVVNIHYVNLLDGAKDDWDLEPRIIFQNTISSRFSLAYMLRYRNDLAFTIVPAFALNDQWSTFIEYFSDIRLSPEPFDENYNGLNIGFGYLVNNRITIDIMYGTVFTENVNTNLLTTGLGWWIR
jgi:hypothetical protein